MTDRVIDIPDAVRKKAIAHGVEGKAWLDRLEFLIGDLERDWGLTIGRAFGGGSESYVAAATTQTGTDVTIKLLMPPYASFANEVRTLLAADGHAYVRLIDHDQERHAMLLERLGPSLSESGLPLPDQIEILCTTLQRAWKVSAPPGLPSGAEKARWLAGFIAATWEALGQPCSQRVVEQAYIFAESREAAFDPASAVLVHGDAHSVNVLHDPSAMSGHTRFKLVDPDGLLAEPAYDLAISMREWSSELLAGDAVQSGRERCASLSRLTGVDPRAIWEWGFIERVSTGLLLTHVGADLSGREMLEVAEAWTKL